MWGESLLEPFLFIPDHRNESCLSGIFPDVTTTIRVTGLGTADKPSAWKAVILIMLSYPRKSTLLLQVAAMLGPEPAIGALEDQDADEEGPPEPGEAVLYVSAEESVEQVPPLLRPMLKPFPFHPCCQESHQHWSICGVVHSDRAGLHCHLPFLSVHQSWLLTGSCCGAC